MATFQIKVIGCDKLCSGACGLMRRSTQNLTIFTFKTINIKKKKKNQIFVISITLEVRKVINIFNQKNSCI